MLYSCIAPRCRVEPFLDQGGACGAASPASAPGSALAARPAHAGPSRRAADQFCSYGKRPTLCAATASGSRLSSSRRAGSLAGDRDSLVAPSTLARLELSSTSSHDERPRHGIDNHHHEQRLHRAARERTTPGPGVGTVSATAHASVLITGTA